MHVAVTGASTGIGAGIVREFARAGAKVTLVARRRELMEKLAAELAPGTTFVVAADLARPEAACDWLAPAEAALGPIDVLVNNAGVQYIEPTAEADVERGETVLKINVFTPMRLTRAVLPAMIARGSGTIVQIASLAALAPTPGLAYYNASKAALAAASEALRGELRKTGVNVVTVYPGIIDTDMATRGLARYEGGLAVALQPHGTPEALARIIRRAVERRRARVIYPRMNALARWFPGLTRWILDHFTPPIRRAS